MLFGVCVYILQMEEGPIFAENGQTHLMEGVLGGIAWRFAWAVCSEKGRASELFLQWGLFLGAGYAAGALVRWRLCMRSFLNTLTNFKLGNAEYSDRWEHQVVVAFPETNRR